MILIPLSDENVNPWSQALLWLSALQCQQPTRLAHTAHHPIAEQAFIILHLCHLQLLPSWCLLILLIQNYIFYQILATWHFINTNYYYFELNKFNHTGLKMSFNGNILILTNGFACKVDFTSIHEPRSFFFFGYHWSWESLWLTN